MENVKAIRVGDKIIVFINGKRETITKNVSPEVFEMVLGFIKNDEKNKILNLFSSLESSLDNYLEELAHVKEWIDKKTIGRILHFKSEWGEYMPSWHPWENYKSSYAGKKEMGGGVILTLSHEIDLCLFFCGIFTKVSGNFNSISDLKLNTEDLANILISFKSGVCANIHLNYLSRPPSRKIDIIGSKGQISFDYYKNQVKLFIRGKQSKSFDVSKTFNRNNLFINELKDFFNIIQNKKINTNSIDHAFKIVKLANMIKKQNK